MYFSYFLISFLAALGHAYEAISTDAIARYHRMYGRDVFFLTGTDEHGQKIANRAETEGVKPIDICDKYANGFVELNKKLRISNDSYIRTTMPHHYKSAQTLWELCAKGKYRNILCNTSQNRYFTFLPNFSFFFFFYFLLL